MIALETNNYKKFISAQVSEVSGEAPGSYGGFHPAAPNPAPQGDVTLEESTTRIKGNNLDTNELLSKLEELNNKNKSNIEFLKKVEKDSREVADNVRLIHEQIRRRRMEISKEISNAANLPMFWEVTLRIYKQLDKMVKELEGKQREMAEMESSLVSIQKTVTAV